MSTPVTIGLSQAERLATGAPHPTGVSMAGLVRGNRDPASLAHTSRSATLGDAAARFALCCGELTEVLVDPTGPPWVITPTPRHRWRRRQQSETSTLRDSR